MTFSLFPSPAAAGLRLFVVHNETTQHGCEIDASSHADAVSRYRAGFDVQGFACIKTSDAEVFFGLRPGVLQQVHLSYEVEHPGTRA